MPLVAPQEGHAVSCGRAAKLLERLGERLRCLLAEPRPFEFRMVQSIDYLHPQRAPPERQIWFRAVDALAEDEMLHRRLLAYVSDFFLLDTATLPHGTSFLKPTLAMATIDHPLWFHPTLRAH